MAGKYEQNSYDIAVCSKAFEGVSKFKYTGKNTKKYKLGS